MSKSETSPLLNDDALHPCVVPVSRRIQWLLSFVFVAGLLIPPGTFIWNQSKGEPGLMEKIRNRLSTQSTDHSRQSRIVRQSPSLLDRIGALEKETESDPLNESSQKNGRRLQFELLHEGNRQVYPGNDGWLFYRPGLDSLTGPGPLHWKPDKHTGTAGSTESRNPVSVIVHFAHQLRQRGIDLMLLTVPDKASVQPEGIIRGDHQIRVHPDRNKLYFKLAREGIEIVDLLPIFEKERRAGRDVFLKQDTHWKPRAMELAARKVAQVLKRKNLLPGHPEKFARKKIKRSSLGDLVGLLDLGAPSLFAPEKVALSSLSGPRGDSPLVLLGDSFVNIYDDPSLGFGIKGESRIGAGFASQLAATLGFPVETFAINGDGATAPRQAFCAQTDEWIRSKKQVVWLIAERDLFLSHSAGLAAGVHWKNVEFTGSPEKVSGASGGQEIVITARLREKSRIRDPKQSPYTQALYAAKFDSVQVLSGPSLKRDTLTLFLWAFRDRKFLPTARIKEGQVYRLTLLPLNSLPEIRSVPQMNDFSVTELPLFAEKAERIP